MAKAIDELLTISRLPGSPITYDGPANSTGASVLEIALSGQDPNNIMIPGQHMTGTTIMGIDDGTKNGSSVVDPNCKVYGTGTIQVNSSSSSRLANFAKTISLSSMPACMLTHQRATHKPLSW